VGWQELQQATNGQWLTLLPSNGVGEEYLSRKQGPCPRCGGKTKFRTEQKDGGIRFWCNSCTPKGSDGFGLIALVKGIDRNEAIKEVAEQMGMGLSAEKKADKREESRTPMSTLQKRWNECIEIGPGSAAGKYLKKRGLKNPHSEDLGSHPALGYYEESNGKGRPIQTGEFHALIALVTTITGEPVGLQYIYLTPDGDKAPVPAPKKRQVSRENASAGACVKIDQFTDEDEELQIAEGIETAIYVRGVTGLPTWAGMTANIMAQIEVPPTVKRVYIYADNDKSGTGLKAAYDLADRLTGMGIECYVLMPPKVGEDWLDAKSLTKKMLEDAKPYSYLDRWPDVKPLHKLLDVLPFDDELMMPECWRAYARDLAATLQVPLDFIAVSLMMVFATIIGASCAVRPKAKAGWQEVCNLWGVLIGYPSQLKTPTTLAVLSLIFRLDDRAEKEYQQKLEEYNAEKESYALQKSTLKSLIRAEMKKSHSDILAGLTKKSKELKAPKEPVEKCFYTNESSIEAMYKTLEQNPRGVLLYRDELSAMLIGWDSPRRAGEKQFYMEGHKGLGKFKRKTKSEGTEKPKNVVSVFGTMTPDTMKSYVNYAQRFGSDGFVQRLQLMVYPDLNEQEWHDEYEDKEAKARAYNAAVLLADSEDMQEFGAIKNEGDKYAYFNFTYEAQEHFKTWFKVLLAKLKEERDPHILSHLSKYRGLMPVIACILHLADCADKGTRGPITLEAAQMASNWMEYLESHARRVYALRTGEASKAAELLSEKIELGLIGEEPFTVRQLTEKDWTGLTEREVIYVALDQLVAANYLRAEKVAGPGTPTIKYTVNPKVFLS